MLPLTLKELSYTVVSEGKKEVTAPNLLRYFDRKMQAKEIKGLKHIIYAMPTPNRAPHYHKYGTSLRQIGNMDEESPNYLAFLGD